MIIEIASGKHKLEIDSIAGGRAAQWFVDDLQILGPKGDHPLVGGWYLMAPWAGRIRDNQVTYQKRKYPQKVNFQKWAIHGTVAFNEGKVQNQTSDSVEIVHKTNSDWPISMEILQRWSITSKYLKCYARISTIEGEFPAELGWHPWFNRQLTRGKPAKFGIEAVSQFKKDENFFTLNETKEIGIPPFDDAFVVPTGRGFIEWPEALRIDFSTDLETFVVFDEPKDVFCIEPQTGPPDAINRATNVVTPQNPLEASVKWEITAL
jgi:aldose 1-epimerase